jgi:AraC-like DNA-binding protein
MTNGDYEWFLARAVPILHKSGRLHEWLGILIRQRGLKGVDPVNASADSLLTPMQIRAGRAMLQWTLEDLSQHSGVSISSIRRIEAEGERATRPASLNAIRQAFEQEGLIFTDGNGVALQRAEGRRL